MAVFLVSGMVAPLLSMDSADAAVGFMARCTTGPKFVFARQVASSGRLGSLTLTACVNGVSQSLSVPAASGQVADDCATNAGWLPLGTYSIYSHTSAGPKGFNGLIKGTTFGIGVKKCRNGTKLRKDLFIHSEMTKTGGQGKAGTYSAWDGRVDYSSHGCIKLSPADIGQIDSLYNRADLRRGRGTLTVVAA